MYRCRRHHAGVPVAWVSTEAVTTATVRVSRCGRRGRDHVDLGITLVSASSPPALTRGVVKVGVAGLSADTSVFVQT